MHLPLYSKGLAASIKYVVRKCNELCVEFLHVEFSVHVKMLNFLVLSFSTPFQAQKTWFPSLKLQTPKGEIRVNGVSEKKQSRKNNVGNPLVPFCPARV